MTYIEINGTRYPAEINGKKVDRDWDDRESKTITLAMSYADALALFVNGLVWYDASQDDPYIEQTEVYNEETGEYDVIETEVVPDPIVNDNTAFCIAGDITDHRDGYVSVKMGMPTELEALQAQLANAVTEDELTKAYTEGVNSL